MGTLEFPERGRHFDGECVRFKGVDGDTEVVCGVTITALKHHVRGLPEGGLLPAEVFLEAFDRNVTPIQMAARLKYRSGALERDGDVLVMVHDRDWPY